MNLRILKKLSKRAEPLLRQLGERRQIFVAERNDDCYSSRAGHDRKHWERSQSRYPGSFHGDRYYMPKHGNHHVCLREPSTVLSGTVMVGAMTGYYEPEWDEDDAWSRLHGAASDYYVELVLKDPDSDDFSGFDWRRTRRLSNPSDILRAVRDLIKQQPSAEGYL